MKFDLIPVEDLHAHWSYVRSGLERIIEQSPAVWIPEDIYAHLRFKAAVLYLASDDDGKRRGFVVTEVKRLPHSGEMTLHIWALYAEPVRGDHFADVKQFLNEGLEFFDACARHVKATKITQDGRWGWTRFLGEAFTPVLVRYERRVA